MSWLVCLGRCMWARGARPQSSKTTRARRRACREPVVGTAAAACAPAKRTPLQQPLCPLVAPQTHNHTTFIQNTLQVPPSSWRRSLPSLCARSGFRPPPSSSHLVQGKWRGTLAPGPLRDLQACGIVLRNLNEIHVRVCGAQWCCTGLWRISSVPLSTNEETSELAPCFPAASAPIPA